MNEFDDDLMKVITYRVHQKVDNFAFHQIYLQQFK